jgi:hypothetical protein
VPGYPLVDDLFVDERVDSPDDSAQHDQAEEDEEEPLVGGGEARGNRCRGT